MSHVESHINSFLELDKVAATQHINNSSVLRLADLHATFFEHTGYLAIMHGTDQRAIYLNTVGATVATDSSNTYD